VIFWYPRFCSYRLIVYKGIAKAPTCHHRSSTSLPPYEFHQFQPLTSFISSTLTININSVSRYKSDDESSWPPTAVPTPHSRGSHALRHPNIVPQALVNRSMAPNHPEQPHSSPDLTRNLAGQAQHPATPVVLKKRNKHRNKKVHWSPRVIDNEHKTKSKSKKKASAPNQSTATSSEISVYPPELRSKTCSRGDPNCRSHYPPKLAAANSTPQSVVNTQQFTSPPSQQHRPQPAVWEGLPRDNQVKVNALKQQNMHHNQASRVPPSVPDPPRRQGPPPTPRPPRLPTPDLEDISGRRFCNCAQHYCEHRNKAHGRDEIHFTVKKMNTQRKNPRLTRNVVPADCCSRRCDGTHQS
jgi:hypothetical protein